MAKHWALVWVRFVAFWEAIAASASGATGVGGVCGTARFGGH